MVLVPLAAPPLALTVAVIVVVGHRVLTLGLQVAVLRSAESVESPEMRSEPPSSWPLAALLVVMS